MKSTMIIIPIIFIAGLGMVATAFADSENIVNHISVSAASGGNFAPSGGTVVNGLSSVSVHISQSIDGISQPPINITTTSPSGIGVDVNTMIIHSGETSQVFATSSIKIRTGTQHINTPANTTSKLSITPAAHIPTAPLITLPSSATSTTKPASQSQPNIFIMISDFFKNLTRSLLKLI